MTTPNLPVLNRENAAPGTPLRSYPVTFGENEIAAYVDRTGENIDAYRSPEGVTVPPGMLMGCYGRLIHQTFFYETGVHVSSDLKIMRLPLQDEPLQVTGEVLDLFTRNGNEYVRFSVNVATTAGEPLTAVEHVSIYKFKVRTSGTTPPAAATAETTPKGPQDAAGTGEMAEPTPQGPLDAPQRTGDMAEPTNDPR